MSDIALIIIDMQPTYLGNWKEKKCNSVITKIVKEIQEAKKKRHRIIVVEFGFDRTIKDITKHVRGYKKVSYVEKYGMDGSKEIKDIVKDKKWKIKKLKVTGCFTDACVKETVDGINNYNRWSELKEIEVVWDGCYTTNNWVSPDIFRAPYSIIKVK